MLVPGIARKIEQQKKMLRKAEEEEKNAKEMMKMQQSLQREIKGVLKVILLVTWLYHNPRCLDLFLIQILSLWLLLLLILLLLSFLLHQPQKPLLTSKQIKLKRN